jgi:hypothetical protein
LPEDCGKENEQKDVAHKNGIEIAND